MCLLLRYKSQDPRFCLSCIGPDIISSVVDTQMLRVISLANVASYCVPAPVDTVWANDAPSIHNLKLVPMIDVVANAAVIVVDVASTST